MVAYFQTMCADTPKLYYLTRTHTHSCLLKDQLKKKIRCGLRQRSYFGHVGALHVVFVDPDLLFILSPHVRQGLRQFVLVLLLPSGVHLHQSSLVALTGVLHLLKNSRNQSQKSFTVFSGVIKWIDCLKLVVIPLKIQMIKLNYEPFFFFFFFGCQIAAIGLGCRGTSHDTPLFLLLSVSFFLHLCPLINA